MADIAAIILAAGSAKRFGSIKLLEPLTLDDGTMPLMAYTIRPWLAIFETVTLVVNVESSQLQTAVDRALQKSSHRLQWLVCENAVNGMGASLSCGVKANSEADGWLVGLGDMPMVPANVIGQIKQSLLNGAALAAPFYTDSFGQELRGHPVGLAKNYQQELLNLQRDSGAKDILARDKSLIHRIESYDAGICIDIDTLADLQHANDIHLRK